MRLATVVTRCFVAIVYSTAGVVSKVAALCPADADFCHERPPSQKRHPYLVIDLSGTQILRGCILHTETSTQTKLNTETRLQLKLKLQYRRCPHYLALIVSPPSSAILTWLAGSPPRLCVPPFRGSYDALLYLAACHQDLRTSIEM